MSIAGVVLRGYGSAGVNYVVTAGYGNFSATPNTGPGRLEFTMPKSRFEFTIDNGRLEFTMPKNLDEFGEQ